MSNNLAAMAAVIVSIQLVNLSAVSPAAAISADLAKKCRGMAIKAHPPAPAGTSPYAQAEREFFRECISKNGDMHGNGPQKSSPPGQQ
jgi:hypothetical protein